MIDAIRRCRAQTEVLRRIIYIQPGPRRPLDAPTPRRTRRWQGWLAGQWRTAVSVNRSHQIVLELLKFRQMN
jgi:hypothetical protein